VPTIESLEGLPVRTGKGKRYGMVDHVLFHPSEPTCVGLQVQPRAIGFLFTRKPVYILLSDVDLKKHSVEIKAEKKPPARRASEKQAGFSWNDTVIWRGMDVRRRAGKKRGVVMDVEFSPDGAVRFLTLTEGATADAAVGRRTVPVEEIVGFDGEDVVVEDEAATEDDFEGGLAASAGKTTAVAKVSAEVAAKKAVSYGKATAKVASESDMGKKAMGALRGLAAEVKDAMELPEDDDE
jgi:uncharacterized protein YrrD